MHDTGPFTSARSPAPRKRDALAAALAALEALGQEERPPPARELVSEDSTENAAHLRADTIGTATGRDACFAQVFLPPPARASRGECPGRTAHRPRRRSGRFTVSSTRPASR